MSTLKKILFPTDFSRCANQTLAHALYLAKRHQAEVHMLHVTRSAEFDPGLLTPYTTDAEAWHRSLAEMASQQMAAGLKIHPTAAVRIKQAYRRGISTAPEILQYAKDNEVDLIVMGTHGRRGLGHLFLGSVAEEVVRMAQCSVLTIREREEPVPVEVVENILVPVDFSDFSKTALAYAKEMAVAYRARLQFLHVVEEIVHPAWYWASDPSLFAFGLDLKATIVKEMKNLFKETKGPEVAADFYVLEGRAANAIVNFAGSHNSDLIVISTHGLTGLAHMLQGSVT
ncbi:MAG: universal stress protein, partial [bacterium]